MSRPSGFDWLPPHHAGHLAQAVRMYRLHCRKQGQALPADFAEYESALASQWAMAGQGGPMLDATRSVPKPEPVPIALRLLTIPQVAAALNGSPSTVKRRIADGTLLAVKVGGLTRIRVEDLDTYLDQLGAPSCV